MKHIEIIHLEPERKSVIHAQTVGRDGARTLCGEDTSGDYDREIIGATTKKITCVHCIELIVGIHRFFRLTELKPAAIAESRSAKRWIEEIAGSNAV